MKITRNIWLALLMPVLISTSSLSAAEHQVSHSQTEPSAQGKFIWADLYTANVSDSIDFYTKTFGWTVKNFGDKTGRYHIFYDGDKPVAGVLARSADRKNTDNALWIGSLATENVTAVTNSAAKQKATVILAPHEFALYGERSVIADPHGGIIALLDLDEQNKHHQNISNKWGWAQLFSATPEKAAAFYQAAFNFAVENVADNKNAFYLSKQQIIRASIVQLPASFGVRDRWVNFIDVSNLDELIKRAISNGAEIIKAPKANDHTAIIADPQGAILGLTDDAAYDAQETK